MFGCICRRGLQQQLDLCYDMLVPSCPCLPVHPTLLQVVPRVKELANDSSQFVRAALAGVVMELAPQLGKQPTIEHLVPVFLNLLRDPYPDVRLNVISKLDQVKRGSCGAAHSKMVLRTASPSTTNGGAIGAGAVAASSGSGGLQSAGGWGREGNIISNQVWW